MAKRHGREIPSVSNPPPAVLNRLLATLPANHYARISSTLNNAPRELKQILNKPGETIQHVYFPGDGFCSVATVLENGGMIEVATIGREGMVGMSAVLDDGPPL
jgi:CRP-like cAMP-binding protein